MFRDSACQETVTSHVPRFRICFLAGSASHVYCSTELSRFRVDKKPRWYCSMQHTWAMLQLWLSMYFCYFMLFASKMSPYICDFCLQHRSQHLQHWEGLPLLLPSGIAKKGSGNAWTAFKNPQNKRQVSVKVCSPFCAPEMRGHSNLRVLRFLGLHKRKSRNHTVQNSQTLRTKCAELGLLDECLGSVGLKSKISPFFSSSDSRGGFMHSSAEIAVYSIITHVYIYSIYICVSYTYRWV